MEVEVLRERADRRPGSSSRHSTSARSHSQQGRSRAAPKIPMHQNSFQIQDCLNPVRGIRDAMRRQGLKPVNHAQLNAEAVRSKSLLNQQRKEEEMRKATQPARRPSDLATRVKSSGYGTPDYNPRLRNSLDGDVAGCNQKENAQQPGNASRGIKQWIPRDDFGKVPQYLQSRKLELAQKHAEEQARKEAALIPPGMRIMPSEEREEMLRTLAESKADVQKRIQALPFVIETPSQIRHKDALEKRMKEIEQATALFSRPKILIQA